MNFYGEVCALCKEIECEYSTEALLKDYTTFKIGGKAGLMVFPDTAEKLSALIAFSTKNNIKRLVIGKGSNLLADDKGFDGVVINTCKMDNIYLTDETTIFCQCGVPMSRLCKFALENSITGLEFAFGIPGTAGGAAFMNAGAYGGEIKDVLVSCEHICPDGTIGKYEGDELQMRYRGSVYSSECIDYTIASLTLKLQKGNPIEIKAEMDELLQRRKDKQPLEYPSAGSAFKRPEGNFAGALIERCGLKGFRVGDAAVSEKHAGFVVNLGCATSGDVKAVLEHCRQTVFVETGIMLEPEIKFI